jgi:hypothetical protein
MRRTRRQLFALLALACVGLFTSVQAADPKPSGRVPMPTVKIEKGERCVEPTEEMRRNHMEKILHQRDRTVHQGVRTIQHSLKNCVNCHAAQSGSVLGKDGFCASCHQYASVHIYCFGWHTDKPEKETAKKVANAQNPAPRFSGKIQQPPQGKPP